jgi:integrase
MRPRKPPRLYLRKSGLWVILDQSKEIATGLRDEELAKAALAKYLSVKLSDVILHHLATHKTQTEFGEYMAKPLLAWWGDLRPEDVTEISCRAYAQQRGKKPATIRHELQFLAASLRSRTDVLPGSWRVWLPPMPPPRTDYFLTRREVARRLWVARHSHPHVCRAILIGVYSGTRRGATLALRWAPSKWGGWVDLDVGILHRAPEGEAETRKRKGKARIHFRLLAHLRRWKRLDGDLPWIIHYRGEQPKNIRRAWNTVTRLAGQKHDGQHICRHTCATWLLQSGVSYHEASGFLSMSVETLEKTYGHHSPSFQQAAARARGR